MIKKIFIIFLIFASAISSGFGCKMVDKKTQEAMQPITLEYWRVWDGPDAFDDILASYKKLYPNITINYKKFRYDEYEQALLEAMAEDRGPDILSIQNTWVKKYQNKLEPMPAQTQMVRMIETGTLKKEYIPKIIKENSLTLRELKNNFFDSVYSDVVISENDKTGVKENIYGLPLSVDTMVLYYNRDLFNNANISSPPVSWNEEFHEDVKKLTMQDDKGNIVQSGVALGGAKNINRSFDILSLLMMQNGAEMSNSYGSISFNKVPSKFKAENYNPGLEALRFYTDFANPAKEVYSWNENLENSLDLFVAGKVGMMFGYAYDLPTIRSRNPKLNFAVAAMPQISGSTQPTNFANYWVEAVSKKTKYKNEAWNFIQFATSADQAQSYLTSTGKPTALRSLVDKQKENDDLFIFANQLLTSKSWYRGKDPIAVEQIFNDMISSVQSGVELDDAINTAASRVAQTFN